VNLYFSVNPDPVNLLKGTFVLYWLLTIAGLLIIGMGFYDDWRYRRSFRHWPFSFLGIIFIIVAYQISWSYFYVVTVKDRKIYLQYFFPQRTKTIPIHKIKSLDRRYFGKSRLYHFLIETRDGKIYSSAATKDEKLDWNEKELKKYLQRELGYSRKK